VQSLCPRACAPQLASVIHVSVQNITENACCTSASSGTAFSSVKILLKVYRGEVPMSPNTTPGVATVGHCRYFWFPMFPKQQEQPNSGLIPGVSCFRMLQNASECFSFTHQTRITCCSQHQRQECSMVRPRAAVMQRSGADMNCIIRRHGEDNVQLNRADWSWRLLWGQVPRD